MSEKTHRRAQTIINITYGPAVGAALFGAAAAFAPKPAAGFSAVQEQRLSSVERLAVKTDSDLSALTTLVYEKQAKADERMSRMEATMEAILRELQRLNSK